MVNVLVHLGIKEINVKHPTHVLLIPVRMEVPVRMGSVPALLDILAINVKSKIPAFQTHVKMVEHVIMEHVPVQMDIQDQTVRTKIPVILTLARREEPAPKERVHAHRADVEISVKEQLPQNSRALLDGPWVMVIVDVTWHPLVQG